MSNEVDGRESSTHQERISRLTPAQREMLQKRLRGEGPRSQSKPVIQPRPTLDYPITAEQEHLWVQHQVDPNAHYFNHSHAHLLKGELNVAALERAINEMVRRHENLRTSLPEVDGKPRAVVAPHLELTLERVEVPEFPAETRHERLQALITAHTCRPFDILNGPLIRATLYRVTEQEHAVLITLHHLVTDFVSYDLVDNEFFALYEAFSRGLPSPLPELPIQYGDFALWLDQWMKSEEAGRQSDYWVRKLADLPRLDLVTDLPRPRSRSFRGQRIVWMIPEPLWSEFKQLMFSESVTRFTAVLVFLGMLLREYSGKEDIPIATPVSSRKHRETQPIIGYFLNTIVYRLDLSDDPTFRELLQRTRLTTLEAMVNSDLPFEFLLKKLQAERDPSRAPLVDASYAFGNDHKPPQAPGGLALEQFDSYYRSAWLDINLGVNDNTDHAVVLLDYLTELFLPSTAERMMLHFQRFFAQAVADPNRRLSGFSLVSDGERLQILGNVNAFDLFEEQERHQILVDWNNTAAAYPSTETIQGCFTLQVAKAGSAIALRAPHAELSYHDLNQQANRLAHRLITAGVRAETAVAVLVERSADMVVATLAVLKAGGAYLPLHPAYPVERMRLILEEAEAAVLLLDRTTADRGIVHPEIIVVDDDPYLIAEDDSDPDVLANPDQLAYIMYTSGSTGTPKGVAVSHRNVVSLAFDRSWQEGSLERVLFHSSPAFDASTFEMWAPLLRGKQVIIPPPGDLDIAAYRRLFQEEKVTTTFFTASLFSLLVQEAPDCFSGVPEIWAGGDVVPVGAVQSLHERCPGTLVCNGYGPTETTTFATHYAASDPARLTGSVPIGSPMDNHQVYVLDPFFHPVPVGVPGELFIAGDGLARGYLKRPGLTAERFVPNPFGDSGGRMYRTGDRVRWREDGQVEFLGRNDHQVKLRGYRIELAEIEAALLGCTGVKQAAVVLHEDHLGEKRLAAYVVAAPGHTINPAELRDSLKHTLPEYMVPAFIRVLASLPLNSNGKLDRKALPAAEFIGSGHGRAPRSRAEEIFCALLKEVLVAPHAAPDDNFFSLGGDSILAIQLVSRARQAGLIVSLTDVFEQPTVEALAAVSRPVQEAVGAVADVGVGPMPATPIMCWFLEVGGTLQRFSQSMMLQVPAGLKQDDLVQALQALLDHHDALRLCFTEAEGSREEWRLEVREQGGVSAASCLQRVDVAGLEEGELRRRMEEEGAAAAGRLSAEKGEMLQAVWFDGGEKEGGRLLLTIHHLCVDGVSWRILLPDLAAAWAAVARGESPKLEASSVSFRGWAERLRQEAVSPERVKELSFWREMLEEKGELVLGRELDRRRDTVGKAGQIAMTLPSSVTGPLLNRVAGAFHARINDVLLTGLVLSLRNWKGGRSGGTSVLIDVEGHGREGIFEGLDLSRTVGFFTSLYPVRLDAGAVDVEEAWAGGKALGVALKAIKEQLRAVPDNGIGYGLLRYMNAETGAVLSKLVKPQIAFNYLGRFGVGGKEDWAPTESLSGGMEAESPLHHPLQMDAMVLERAGKPELTAVWTWGAGIYREEEVRTLAEGWFEVLGALVRHSEEVGAGGLTPSDVPLVAVKQSEIERLEREYGEIEDLLPLSPVQEGMLFHAFYDAGGPDVYNIQILLGVEGKVEEELLQEAVKGLLLRHKNLRAAFQHEELMRPVQIIPKEVGLPWRRVDLSGLGREERERKLDDLVKQDRLARFDPGTSPLFRFLLVDCGPTEFRLLITTHHIMIDGWSVPLMISQLRMLYECRGNYADLPGVVPFRDYLAWLAGRDRNAAENAWREGLAGLEEGTRLSPAPFLGDSKISERKIVVLEEKLTQRLTEQARAHSLTLNTVIQGVWGVLLSRQTGRDDVVFGSTVSGRSPEIIGVETMVGLLINTVPTRVQVRSSDTFKELLGRLNQEQSRLFAHHYLGLAEIQRLTGMNELFDTLVVFENYPLNADAQKELPGVRFTVMDLNDATHYPLAVVVAPGQSLALYLNYHPDHFSADVIDGMGRRIVRLLTAYADAPDQPVTSIDLLNEQERRQILVEFNQTRTEYPRDKTIMELFAEQIERRGNELAVICDQQQLSYLELDRRSNQLGRHLRKLGVRAEKLVGISMDRSVDMVIAMVGVLKAGGAYVPIDPAYPPDRLRYMLEDSGIEVLLTQRRLAHHMPAFKTHVVCLDRDWDEIAQQNGDALQSQVCPENLVYVIYTSGSTGQPKATAVSHRSLIRLLRQTNYIELSGDEVMAQTVNMSFDPSTFEIWGALVNGCRLVIFSNEVLLDVERFAAEIKDKGVKVLFLATALFNEVGRQNPAMFNSVKHLLFGGEAVHPGTAAAVVEHGGPEQLVNAYGPAECTTFTSFYVVREVPAEATSVPIGKPVANTQVYVLDRNMNLEPVGVTGQLYVGGEGLARGYWGRPELTAERFVPDPYGEAGGRLYASGDLARWMEDGNLEFFGRADNQIKIRSFRVELGEIEGVLLQHAGVRDCAVLLKRAAADKRLVAYVSGEVDTEQLKNFLKSKLPEYMVPGVYIVLPELPLSTNGKVDRRALPDVEDDLPQTITAVEELLIDIWAEVLGSSRVTVRDGFYDLGGHSLLALRVVSRINDYLQTTLSVRTLLEYPVLMEFAQRLCSISARPAQELEKIARIVLMVRRMTPEERKAALSMQ